MEKTNVDTLQLNVADKKENMKLMHEMYMQGRFDLLADLLYGAPLKESEEEFVIKIKTILQAEDEGRILILPCKLGETVWCIRTARDNYSDLPYLALRQDSFKLSMLERLGKDIFLTREEAQEALDRMCGR